MAALAVTLVGCGGGSNGENDPTDKPIEPTPPPTPEFCIECIVDNELPLPEVGHPDLPDDYVDVWDIPFMPCNDDQETLTLHKRGNHYSFSRDGDVNNIAWNLCESTYPDPAGVSYVHYDVNTDSVYEYYTSSFSYDPEMSDMASGGIAKTVFDENNLFVEAYTWSFTHYTDTGTTTVNTLTENRVINGEYYYRHWNHETGDWHHWYPQDNQYIPTHETALEAVNHTFRRD
ncbi:hypothetical protein [Vibrio ishigakensis]|nr:hypothetical protein [Vibrio ishigakensis]